MSLAAHPLSSPFTTVAIPVSSRIIASPKPQAPNDENQLPPPRCCHLRRRIPGLRRVPRMVPVAGHRRPKSAAAWQVGGDGARQEGERQGQVQPGGERRGDGGSADSRHQVPLGD